MSILSDNSVIKTLIADDHEMVRTGIKKILSKAKNIEVVAEAANGKEALNYISNCELDMLITDILMPIMNGIDLISQVRENYDEIKIITLSAFEDLEHIESAVQAGADGYLTKDVSAKELIMAVQKVYEGERVFSNNILRIMDGKYTLSNPDENVLISISQREKEILNQIAKGKTNKEIADDLFISKRTVETHRSNIMQKLGIKKAAALVRYAVLYNQKQYML